MRQPVTIEDILKSKAGHLNHHLQIKPVKKAKIIKARNDCPQVVKMHWDLKYFCEEKGLKFEKEFQFDKMKKEGKVRKFRFDFAIPAKMIAIEYHGLNYEKSGHTTTKGFNNDTEKLNLANKNGWKMLVYTFATYQNVLQDVQNLINTDWINRELANLPDNLENV